MKIKFYGLLITIVSISHFLQAQTSVSGAVKDSKGEPFSYVRSDALRSDVYFLANSILDTFFINRPFDLRGTLVDFSPIRERTASGGAIVQYPGY